MIILNDQSSYIYWKKQLHQFTEKKQSYPILTNEITIDNSISLYGLGMENLTIERNLLSIDEQVAMERQDYKNDQQIRIKIKARNEYSRRKDELFEYMFNSLNEEFQKDVIDISNPKELFDAIKTRFEAGNDLLPSKCLAELLNCRFNYGNDINLFFNNMRNLWDVIKDCKDYKYLPEAIFIDAIILAMPPELDNQVEIAKEIYPTLFNR